MKCDLTLELIYAVKNNKVRIYKYIKKIMKKKKTTSPKLESWNRTRVAERIFAVWSSKKFGSVQTVFNFKNINFSLLIKSFGEHEYFK